MSQATRSYFYNVDASGDLYHDGTRLQDRAFLDFFFRRLRANTTGTEAAFPWISPCGPEMNFVRAVGTPIIFDRLIAGETQDMLGFNHTSLTLPFEPGTLRLSPSGALLHPARPDAGIPFGRLNSKLMLELAANIEEDRGNYILTYRDRPFPIRQDSDDRN
ncbi:MAG: DUF4505 family protein [bacterium]|nr:DUF4505 family protein [bacterium]